ncbi:hypothetical protein BDV40DRAFT_302653 [Aspergillus tamarii]|uniref:Bacteriophage T5 Orf172 DNA-binding domain-containing protein n=1 Tax=Aspergillus tamarii TaxID=41984 RepID=A0A5N6UMY3_ASPTM|nr:hypothetical protein BDV40DRAFT_302653 [Aspergillus tamarii]
MSVSTFVHFDNTTLEALEASRKCVAKKKGSDERCGQRINVDKLRSFYKRNQDISRNELPLLEIAQLCICGTHRREETNVSRAVEQWTEEISDTSCPPHKALPHTNASLTPSKRNDGRRRSTVSPDHFEKGNRHASPKKVNQRIIDLLNMSRKDKIERGYIYIFSDVNIPNKFKVGRSKTKYSRFGEWEKCYPDLVAEAVIECTDAERGEQLVHAELDQQRLKHPCERCKSKPVYHDEWFEKSLGDIRPIVNRWTAFVNIAYLEDGEMKPEYEQQVPALSGDEERWKIWVQEVLNLNKTSAAATPELVEDLLDSGSSESLVTPKTDSSSASEPPSSPILPIPCAFPKVEEPVCSLPSAIEHAVATKPLDGKAPKGEEEMVTFFGLAKRIVSVVAGYSS